MPEGFTLKLAQGIIAGPPMKVEGLGAQDQIVLIRDAVASELGYVELRQDLVVRLRASFVQSDPVTAEAVTLDIVNWGPTLADALAGLMRRITANFLRAEAHVMDGDDLEFLTRGRHLFCRGPNGRWVQPPPKGADPAVVKQA